MPYIKLAKRIHKDESNTSLCVVYAQLVQQGHATEVVQSVMKVSNSRLVDEKALHSLVAFPDMELTPRLIVSDKEVYLRFSVYASVSSQSYVG